MKYSDQIADWLVKLGYTHCFYVAGGNIMHLLESLSQRLDCRPVIHEVTAGIAAEYFNEISNKGKALTLVTAGPGLTNLLTAMAGAYLESRELLVIGGQVKTSDLARGKLRQRGIQEIDGVALARSITVRSKLLDAPLPFADFAELIHAGSRPRKGPVFIEIPLDIQARDVNYPAVSDIDAADCTRSHRVNDDDFYELVERIKAAERPLLLLGGGVSRNVLVSINEKLVSMGLPIATTWNAADRVDSANAHYVGRPNTWGQRSANLILQQCDLLVALGTRLGMQQTGFNWQSFIPIGKVVQVDLDGSELDKGHPRIDMPLQGDANDLLIRLAQVDLGNHAEWIDYTQNIRNEIPLVESVNKTGEEYISPYVFADKLSDLCNDEDIVIPCSSGSAFTVLMQTFRQKFGQLIVTNKGLASMGYGLSGAIGACIAYPDRRVILVEGDGGFAQNLQEIGTAAINQLNLKIFIFDDSGYASIRMTQKSYFGGRYIGCDRKTGLGLPNWEKLFAAWDVSVTRIGHNYETTEGFKRMFEANGTAAFIVSIDPEQTYFPKITSQVTEAGFMVSNPLHLMTPDLEPELFKKVTKFMPI